MIVLASASPRRAELLRAAGIAFRVIVADVDESVQPGEAADRYARRVAEAKARAVLPRAAGAPVLAADTVVVVEGEILGKPVDAADARRMLRLLSGRRHQVITAVAWFGAGSGTSGQSAHAVLATESTTVEFAALTEAEIDWYVGSEEPIDKAGAYAIQGLASRFIPRIEGSYSNVVGLPMAAVYQLLKTAGWRYPESSQAGSPYI